MTTETAPLQGLEMTEMKMKVLAYRKEGAATAWLQRFWPDKDGLGDSYLRVRIDWENWKESDITRFKEISFGREPRGPQRSQFETDARDFFNRLQLNKYLESGPTGGVNIYFLDDSMKSFLAEQ